MNKQFFFLRDLCSTIGTCITLTLTYLYICAFMMRDYAFDFYGIAFIVITLVADWIFRKHIHNVIVFILLHFALFIFLAIFPLKIYQMIILACIGFYVFYSAIAYWKKEALQKDSCAIQMPGEIIILYIIIFIHSYYGLSHTLTTFTYIAGIIFFMLDLLDKYFDKIILNTQSAVGSNHTVDSDMYHINTIMISLFVGLMILLVISVTLVISGTSFNFVGRFFKFIGSIIVYLLSLIASPQTTTEKETEAVTQAAAQQNQAAGMAASGNPLLNSIFNVIQIIIYFCIAAGIIYTIYSFLKSYMYRNDKDIDNTNSSNEHDEIVKLKRKRHFHNPFTASSQNEKIRKLYYKKISSFQKKNLKLKASNTPNEISNLVLNAENVSIDELTDIYKQARYGGKELSKDDVTRCRELSK